MSKAQKKALRRHRQRQADRGIARVEISIPEQDRELLRAVAVQLRDGGARADSIRMVLNATLVGEELLDFKKFLEMAPLEAVDLERSRDSGERGLDF